MVENFHGGMCNHLNTFDSFSDKIISLLFLPKLYIYYWFYISLDSFKLSVFIIGFQMELLLSLLALSSDCKDSHQFGWESGST